MKIFMTLFVAMVFTNLAEAQVNLRSCLFKGKRYLCARNVSYGPNDLQNYDIWFPANHRIENRIPLVIFIHGGGYATNTKEITYKTRSQFGMTEYLEHGFAFATINYRKSGDYPFVKGRYGLESPVFMIDAGRALQHMRFTSQQTGIDSDKVALTGVSAGGAISLWLAFHDDLKVESHRATVRGQSTRVSCAAVAGAQTTMNLDEVRNLMTYGEGLNPEDFEVNHLFEFYGLTEETFLEDPHHYQDILADSMKEASVITHLGPEDKDVKIMLSYALGFDLIDIHSAKFGRYLANRFDAFDFIGRTHFYTEPRYYLSEIPDMDYRLVTNTGRGSGQLEPVIDYVKNRCFQD